MASRRNRGPQDKSACRDLSGRRLKAVEQAKQLAEYIAKEPGRERAAREEKRAKLEAVIAANPQAGIKMDDHAYWEDKEKLVEGVKSAVKDAIRAARIEGGKVEVVHTVTVRGAGVKRDLKFAGFEEEYDSDSEDDEEGDTIEEDEESIEDAGEDEYDGSTEEEVLEVVKTADIKGKGKAVAR
jgi:hypothetical protein